VRCRIGCLIFLLGSRLHGLDRDWGRWKDHVRKSGVGYHDDCSAAARQTGSGTATNKHPKYPSSLWGLFDGKEGIRSVAKERRQATAGTDVDLDPDS